MIRLTHQHDGRLSAAKHPHMDRVDHQQPVLRALRKDHTLTLTPTLYRTSFTTLCQPRLASNQECPGMTFQEYFVNLNLLPISSALFRCEFP